MTKRRRLSYRDIVLTLIALAGLTACGGAGAGEPTVAILSPAAGSTVALDEPLSVDLSANDTDGPGVVRLELQVGSGPIEIYEAGGPQPSITTSMMCTPTEEGPTTLMAIAYREDGTSSSPATISLTVAPASGAGEPASGEEAASSEEAPPAQVVQAQANLSTNVRMGPMVDCQIMGSMNQDQVFAVTAVTDHAADNWYRVEDPQGWIWEGNVTLLDDDSSLPRLNVTTCEAGGAVAGTGTGTGTGAGDAGSSGGITAVCGDGTCTMEAGEDCGTCEQDCGPCVAEPACGDGTCSAEVGEDCETCEDDCGPCVVTFAASCGDGVCSAIEDCRTCEDDCGACAAEAREGPGEVDTDVGVCGDGICVPGEDVLSCSADCAINDGYCDQAEDLELVGGWGFDCVSCGDGVCRSEDPESCPVDCYCGDAVCTVFFEDPESCPVDCYCGDGVCVDHWETCTDCPADCTCPADGRCDTIWGEQFLDPPTGDCD